MISRIVPIIALLGFASSVVAQQVAEPGLVNEASLERWITQLAIEELPKEYENKKKWGGTKKVMSGLDVDVQGIKIETRRQWKEVNHGSWSAYKVKFREPEKTFRIELENLRDLGDNRLAFDLIVFAKLDCSARTAEWRRGVQLWSLYAEGEADVRLKASIEVKTGLDLTRLPPDVLLDPKVTTSEITLLDFKLTRVSKADGPLVKQLGGLVENAAEDYLAENRTKLTEKMNAQIAKHREKMRIPIGSLTASKWGDWFGAYLKTGR